MNVVQEKFDKFSIIQGKQENETPVQYLKVQERKKKFFSNENGKKVFGIGLREREEEISEDVEKGTELVKEEREGTNRVWDKHGQREREGGRRNAIE